jgi:hypothetical protein
MSDLSQIQAKFQNALLDQNPTAPEFIISTEKVSANERMEIYGDAYRWRLVEALESNYPMLANYLGDDEFSGLALEYIDAHPSTYRSVRWFGDRFAEFIAEHYSENTLIIEFAELEWVFSLVFDAPDAAILSMHDFSKIEADKWPTLCLKMHPSVHRLDFQWNVVEIWESLMNEAECPEPNMHESTQAWIFWRKDFILRNDSIRSADF